MRQLTKTPTSNGLCFAAGTLIHTKEGLKPIEDIQVGDWMLSQPEVIGESVYKRVKKAVSFEGSPVWTITYHSKKEQDLASAEGCLMRLDCEYRLVVTPDHLFGVKGEGWVQAKDLYVGRELELADGEGAIVVISCPLYRSDLPGVAWQEGIFDPDDGELVDLRNGNSGEREFAAITGMTAAQPVHLELWQESSYFCCTVYNIQVEDCCACYVGTLGVRVCNEFAM